MKRKVSGKHSIIKAMPYSARLKNYEREKNELFMQIAGMTAAQVAQAHQDLARKWGV